MYRHLLTSIHVETGVKKRTITQSFISMHLNHFFEVKFFTNMTLHAIRSCTMRTEFHDMCTYKKKWKYLYILTPSYLYCLLPPFDRNFSARHFSLTVGLLSSSIISSLTFFISFCLVEGIEIRDYKNTTKVIYNNNTKIC